MPRKGSTNSRGYNYKHQKLRKQLAPKVATGQVECWRCGELIEPGQAWDLGHDDDDRTRYRGPEHAARCNRAAAGRKAAANRAAKQGGADTTRPW